MIRYAVPMMAFVLGLFAGGWIAGKGLLPMASMQIPESRILAVMRAHGDVVFEALQDENAKRRQQAQVQAEAALSSHETELLEAGPDTPVMGNPQGRHLVVYFFDATCHFCRAFDSNLKAMLREDAELKLILRPLAILGPRLPNGAIRPDAPSMIAALYLDALWHQSRALMPKVLEALMSRPIPDAEALAALARSFDLDPHRLTSESGGWSRIAANADLFRIAGGQGTPFLLVKGAGPLQSFAGAVDSKTIQRAFRDAGARSLSQ